MSTLARTVAPAGERAGVRTAYNVALAFSGALAMSGLAHISIKLPFTPVPITGQTLGVLLIGASLGPALGASAMLVYLLWGVAGLPVFSPDVVHGTGWEAVGFAVPSAGYLWGFVAAAWAVGQLSRRGWDRSLRSAVGAMLVGEVVIYAFGISWLMAAAHLPLGEGLEKGLYPFVVGDLLKMFAAAGLLPVAWKLAERRSGAGAEGTEST